VVLPALEKPLPSVAVIIDTSASVNDELLGDAITEVQGCLRSLGIRRDLLTVYAADVEARRVRDFASKRVALSGGGGTDMRAAIATALAGRPRPDLVVVLTDGLTPWPNAKPRASVVVGLLGRQSELAARMPPTWAKVVRITDTDTNGSAAHQ